MSTTHLKAAASVSIGVLLIPGGFVPLEEKIVALAQAGFDGIDMYMWDLIPYTEQIFNCKLTVRDVFDFNFSEGDWKLLLQAAERVGALCTSQGLQVVSAVALFDAEGWPKGSEQAKKARTNLGQWSLLMKAMGTSMLVVAANASPSAQTDLDLVAEDLGELADMLHSSEQRIALESLCWSTAAPTWSTAWEVVKRADRQNLGLCIDTFHIAAVEWADPTTASGQLEEPNAVANFSASLKRLTAEVSPEKIFSIQLGDAYKLPSPADPQKLKWPPLLYWAAGWRVKPTTGGGFLPVDQVTDAVLKTGFVGPISIEMFDGGKDGQTPPPGSALDQAKLLSESWDKSVPSASKV
ncbi:hypothetical protein PRZ48_006566 [Zasmidium cellare]|uniref:Xylose isomerase-like TIM barrel domain-containing protein n=1 Tax=Zasmidium cellare TaxID=395010 RepID=A0ABR0ENH3_ZASCE|nr:hypothetical protein PRZ48_006566 [Zasmidium cellare]